VVAQSTKAGIAQPCQARSGLAFAALQAGGSPAEGELPVVSYAAGVWIGTFCSLHCTGAAAFASTAMSAGKNVLMHKLAWYCAQLKMCAIN